MTSSILVGALGRTARIALTDPTLALILEDVLADLRVTSRAPGTAHCTCEVVPPSSEGRRGEVRVAGGVLARPATLDATLAWLIWALNRHVIDGAATQGLTILHAAGAAAARTDTAVLLPADSGAGKSTLVLGLARRGLRYLSDEAIVVDSAERLRGYPKPIAIERGAFHLFEEFRHHSTTSGLGVDRWHLRASAVTPIAHHARLAAIVLPRYEPDATPQLRPLAPARALIRLAACAFAPPPGEVRLEQIEQLASLVEEHEVHELVSGDLEGSVELIIELLDRGTAGGARTAGPAGDAPLVPPVR